MSKKKKKRHLGTRPKRKIRISQCMIVKNEEKNILRALGWARDIAFEQIVVDTGSTDRTVRLAESAGAKVYHFQWVDDFAAAKNFAIDKASGDWIAFLDADEYFSAADAKELTVLLQEIEDCPEPMKYQAVTCSWVQLNDEGGAFSALKQERVFRNEAGLRYEGRIHERLTTTRHNVEDLNLRIMHDGYSKTAHTAADKGKRNQKLLRAELERDPDNAEMMIYLADSLKSDMTGESDKEAEKLFKKALSSGAEIHLLIKKLAYDFLIPYYMRTRHGYGEAARLCAEAVETYPEYMDFYYYSGKLKNAAGDYSGAMRDLSQCEQLLKSTQTPLTDVLLADPSPLYEQLAVSARGLGDLKKAEEYTAPKKAEKAGVRLSQCMIVKNEEANIERALGWARDIAFEQIVVDTGSTDKTVELAEKLGAKVYHFEWINDFSAAKNYAIDRASGDWIAFLDADEYFSEEDAAELMVFLEKLDKRPDGSDYEALTCSLVNLDSKNEPISTHKQQRIFRNKPEIRYRRKIHELLTVEKKLADAMSLQILHTGYATEEREAKGKTERNINVLRDEIERSPGDMNNLVYLANSLKTTGRDEDMREAEELCRKALADGSEIEYSVKRIAYDILVRLYYNDESRTDEFYKFCREAIGLFPEDIDYLYLYAAVRSREGAHSEAFEKLVECVKMFSNNASIETRFAENYRFRVYWQLIKAAQGMGDTESVIKYATLAIVEDKYFEGLAASFIHELKLGGATDDEVISLIKKLYDFTSVKDKLHMVRAAKDAGAIGLAQTILSMITEEERQWLSGGG